MARVQVVTKVIDILLVLADGSASLTEVTRKTGMPKGTAFRILHSLGYEGIVTKDPTTNTYMLGWGLLRIMQGGLRGINLLAGSARPAMSELWTMTEETITLHVRMGMDRVCIDELPSPQPIRYSAPVGSVAPLHVGSAGKVLLAFMDADERRRLLSARPLEAMTSASITDPEELELELAEVREKGWARSAGERVAMAASISVPVRISDTSLAALSVLGPADRLEHERQMEFFPAMQKAAGSIERAAAGEALDGSSTS